MKTTKSLSIALDRLAEVLPKGSVKPLGHGRRVIQFERPGHDRPYREIGTIARCLYVGLFAALTKPEYGGFGMSKEELRDALQLRAEGIPSNGLGAHEEIMLESVALGEGRTAKMRRKRKARTNLLEA